MHWIIVFLTAEKSLQFKRFTEENARRVEKWNETYPWLSGLYPIYWRDDEWVWSEPRRQDLDVYKSVCNALVHASSNKS